MFFKGVSVCVCVVVIQGKRREEKKRGEKKNKQTKERLYSGKDYRLLVVGSGDYNVYIISKMIFGCELFVFGMHSLVFVCILHLFYPIECGGVELLFKLSFINDGCV